MKLEQPNDPPGFGLFRASPFDGNIIGAELIAHRCERFLVRHFPADQGKIIRVSRGDNEAVMIVVHPQ